jgi:hypothetical protein
MKTLNEEVKKIKHLFNYKKGDIITEESLTFYHGGLPPNATLSDIDVFRLSSRQQKRGRNYAGFYMSPDIETDSFALNYHKSKEVSGLHKITLPIDSKAYEYPSSVERITQEELKDLYSKGYDYISGKNLFGNPEYILLNKDIAELELVSDNMDDNEWM